MSCDPSDMSALRCPYQHAYVYISHARRREQDGNRLYQPADRKRWGAVPVCLVQEIMTVMCDTELFTCITPGQKWLFDPHGADVEELTGRVNKGHTASLPHTRHAVVTGPYACV